MDVAAVGRTDLNHPHRRSSKRSLWPCFALTTIILMAIATIFPTTGSSQGRAMNMVINEVLYDPSGTDINGEFVELYNPTNSPIDITGWELTDNDGEGPDIVFDSIVVSAKGFLVISTGPGTNDTDLSDGTGQVFLNRDQGIWGNTGDDVLLLDRTGTPVDYIAYGTGDFVDPPPANSTWSGTLALVPEGYSLGRMPDGDDTDHATDIVPLRPTKGAKNSFDPAPDINEWGISPSEPEAMDDLLVWASIFDDISVKKALVHVERDDGTNYEKYLTFDKAQNRYKTTIPGAPGGQTLGLNIIAFDPLEQMSSTDRTNITFMLNISSQLDVKLSGPTYPVTPGEMFKISGQAIWTNGTQTKGTVEVSIHETMGLWSSDFIDIIDMYLTAPMEEGTFELLITVSSGKATVTKEFELVVKWPKKTVLIELSTRNINGNEALTDQDVQLVGSVKFSDGIPVRGVRVDISFTDTGIDFNQTTDLTGGFSAQFRTPSVAGHYEISVMATVFGSSYSAVLTLEIKDHLSLTIQEIKQMPLGKGQEFNAAGQLSHHNGHTVRNALIVIEVLNTSHKAMTYTDNGGNFSINLTAPFYNGQYFLRITAVSGNSVTSASRTIIVMTNRTTKSPTPGFDYPLIVMVVLAAMVILRRLRS